MKIKKLKISQQIIDTVNYK